MVYLYTYKHKNFRRADIFRERGCILSNKEKKKNESTQSVFTKETVGVVFILFSALCLVFLITGDAVFGKLGTVIDAFLYGAFGKLAYAVTIFGVIEGLLLVIGKKTGIPVKYKIFGTLAFMCVAALFHVISVGEVSAYGDYLKISYDKGAEGFASASAGGFFTALYAYFFSKLTIAGGAVVAGLIAALCVYLIVADSVKKKKTAAKEDKFNGAFVNDSENAYEQTVPEQPVQAAAAPTETIYSPAMQSARAAEQPYKTTKLFVNGADDFAFKTKKESKQKDPPTIKIEPSSNGLPVGRVGASYEEARVDDLEKKIEYIKMPASINFDKTPAQNASSSGVSDRDRQSTVVSDYISKDKSAYKKEEPKGRSIPMYEHDGNKTFGMGDGAEERSKEFERKYVLHEDDAVSVTPIEPQETFRPRSVPKNDFVKPVQPQKTEEPVVKKEEKPVESEPIRRSDRAASLFGTGENLNKEESKKEEKTDFTENRAPESRLTRDRNISKILFGDDEKKGEAKASGEENSGFISRAEKDGNATCDRASFAAAERAVSARAVAQSHAEKDPIAEEPKPEKKLPPINREYHRPPLDLLESHAQTVDASEEDHEGKLETIRRTLEEFHINVEPQGYVQGPSITRYELTMPAGISVKSILKFDDDLRMRLASRNGVRIEAPIPGKNLVGIEVANKHRITVGLREVLEGAAGRKTKKSELIFALGKDIVGNSIVDNLAKGPHFLVAGATGSGKSVCLNVMIVSMIMRYSPEDLRLILIDPKRVGFRAYEHLPHLLIDEIITEPQRCLAVLSWAYEEMERRYKLFEDCETVVSDIDAYNEHVERTAKNTTPRLARIIIIVDELADLMETCKKDMDSRIRALAQKARAAGIHLVLATQRPSVDIITGTIKANLPSRIALKVMNFADSQTILSEAGAEKLLGNGDMLYKNTAMPECERYQGAWISDREINNIVSYIIENNEAYFDDELSAFLDKETKPKQEEISASSTEDDGANEYSDLFLNSLALAITSGTISISQIQRRYQVGYARAGGVVDKMERMGLISGNEGSKARKVFITREEYETRFGPMPENF